MSFFSTVNVKPAEHVQCSRKFQFIFKCPPTVDVGFKYPTVMRGEITKHEDITGNNDPNFFL